MKNLAGQKEGEAKLAWRGRLRWAVLSLVALLRFSLKWWSGLRLQRKIASLVITTLMILGYIFSPAKVESTLLDNPPWGISLSQLQELKGPQAKTFATKGIYNYEPTFGLEVAEALFGYSFRSFYHISRDNDRLYKIEYFLDKKLINNEVIIQASMQIKNYINYATRWGVIFSSYCEESDADVQGTKYHSIFWRTKDQNTIGYFFSVIPEKSAPRWRGSAASASLTLYDAHDERNEAAIKQSGTAVCSDPVGW